MRPPDREAPPVERDDSALVRDTLAGNGYAFDQLVERYQGKIYNLALGITGSPHDAADATQSAFLKVYQNLGRFDPAHRFFSWIYRIGCNEALDLVNRRRRLVPVDDEARETAAGPHRRAAANETGRAIREALAELSPDLRVTVVLRHFHGLTYREMSEIVGVPEKRVKSRLFSARVRLRRRLRAMGLEPESERRGE